MRSHQFAEHLDVTRFTAVEIASRLRSYCRNRFGKPPLPKKGRALRAVAYRRLGARPWKRCS